MIKRNVSAYISLALCILMSVLLLVLVFTVSDFFSWFYGMLHGSEGYFETVVKTVVTAFYCCAPFAGASLAMLIVLLLNILKDKLFIMVNIKCLRYISWCCYAVLIITAVFSYKYFPLIVIAVSMGFVGTLLRIVKNIMQFAVELREENELTI